jgi:glycerol-3-phosphate O-acyltransferase
VQQSLAYGRQAYLQRRISSEASIGKLLFGNAYRLMDNRELVHGEGEDIAERRLQMAQTFRELQRRIERVRAAALP